MNTNPNLISELDLASLPSETITHHWLSMGSNGLGEPVRVPVIVAKGSKEGKTIGLTAAVHGNELNGIFVIQRFFQELDVKALEGTVVGVPVVNVPSFLSWQRRSLDGEDINRIMPGRPEGTISQVYADHVVQKLLRHFDYLVDLHTASNGRINSYYIRADLSDPLVKKMAQLQNAQIIVNNQAGDGTLRGTASEMGIPAITVEVGDPNTFQKGMIRSGLTGIFNLLSYLKMLSGEIEEEEETKTVICQRSYWIYTQVGGLLTVHPKTTAMVEKGEKIATVKNVFGQVIETYHAPERGIVVGKSVSPVNYSGGRVLHLGIPEPAN